MKHFRKHLRLHPDLYRTGWFFVTIVSRSREKAFIGTGKEIIEHLLRSIPHRNPGWGIDWLVAMPDHVHFIVVSHRINPHALPDVVRAFKSLAAYAFKNRFGRAGSLWQPNYYEHIIRSEKSLANIRRYIDNNPLKERLDWNIIDPPESEPAPRTP